MTDDNIYNRIIEIKAKTEIIKIIRSYNNVEKRIWTDKYIHKDHAYSKNNPGYVNVGTIDLVSL